MRHPRIVRRNPEDALVVTDEQLRIAKGNKAIVVIKMMAVDFIKLTTKREWVNEIFDTAAPLSAYNESARNGRTIIMPFLQIQQETGKVTGHEGRHRAAALINAFRSLGRGDPREAWMDVAIILSVNGNISYREEDRSVYPVKRRYRDERDLPRVWVGQFDGFEMFRVPESALKNAIRLQE